MSTSYSQERLIAELAVQRAALVTKRVSAAVNKGLLSKTDSTPVTIADFAAQALLISAIHGAFPSDAFVGEEDSDALRQDEQLQQSVWELVSSTHLDHSESEVMLTSPASKEEMLEIIDLGGRGIGSREGRVWMLDPVDGTAAFLRGEQYVIALALVEDAEEKVGVLGCPNLSLDTGRVHERSVDKEGYGFMFSAVKGQGACMRPMGSGSLQPARKVERSRGGPPRLKDLHFVDTTRSKSLLLENHRQIAEKLGASWPGTDLWSSQMRYVALTVGGGDIMVRVPLTRDTMPYVWDHAGGHLIYREAGGKVTDLEGKDIDFGSGRRLKENLGMVAASEGIHAGCFKVVQQFIKDIGRPLDP